MASAQRRKHSTQTQSTTAHYVCSAVHTPPKPSTPCTERHCLILADVSLFLILHSSRSLSLCLSLSLSLSLFEKESLFFFHLSLSRARAFSLSRSVPLLLSSLPFFLAVSRQDCVTRYFYVSPTCVRSSFHSHSFSVFLSLSPFLSLSLALSFSFFSIHICTYQSWKACTQPHLSGFALRNSLEKHLSHPLFALLHTCRCHHSALALLPDSNDALLAVLRHDLLVKLLQAGEQRSADLRDAHRPTPFISTTPIAPKSSTKPGLL